MTSYEKYRVLLEKTGKTSYRVSKDTGIGTNILTYWKQGRSQPKIDKLKIIADYFGVSLDYFCEDETKGESMNKVELIGRLVRDPVIKEETDSCSARYNLAVNRYVSGKQITDFIPCIAFDKQAEIAKKYLRQGTRIAVIGRINSGNYLKDGVNTYFTQVVVESTEKLDTKPQPEQPPNATEEYDASDMSMPFR